MIQGSAAELNALAEAHLRKFRDLAAKLPTEQLQQVRVKLRGLAEKAAETARLANKAHFTAIQYANLGNRYSLAVVPALDAAALDRKRDPAYQVSPWLDLPVLLSGSEELKGYPEGEVEEVRRAFQAAAAAYRDRHAPDRAKHFGDAMQRFALALAALGEAIEPLRQKLPIPNRDDELMARTAYPPLGATWLEVHYNRLDPFLWTWVLSLAALVALLGAVGPIRQPTFWIGIALMAAAVLMMIYGFALRSTITGYTPVATMFETVAFVALVVALLGLWFTMVPMLSRGLRLAWQWTAIPGVESGESRAERGESRVEREESLRPQLSTLDSGLSAPARLPAVFARTGLVVGVFYVLTMVNFGVSASATGEPAVLLLPRVGIGASMPTVGELLIWIVGLALLAVSLYYLPRAILAAVISLAAVPLAMARDGLAEPLGQVRRRKVIAVCAASIAVLAGCTGYYVPVFDPSIKSLMPILRHSFWLAVHVMTIIASYGAGALAWALGERLPGLLPLRPLPRPDARPAGVPWGDGSRPTRRGIAAPAPSNPRRISPSAAPRGLRDAFGLHLQGRADRVILLYVGTVLGAVWADKAWGRYWGWDPKEVWALVSLLIYLAGRPRPPRRLDGQFRAGRGHGDRGHRDHDDLVRHYRRQARLRTDLRGAGLDVPGSGDQLGLYAGRPGSATGSKPEFSPDRLPTDARHMCLVGATVALSPRGGSTTAIPTVPRLNGLPTAYCLRRKNSNGQSSQWACGEGAAPTRTDRTPLAPARASRRRFHAHRCRRKTGPRGPEAPSPSAARAKTEHGSSLPSVSNPRTLTGVACWRSRPRYTHAGSGMDSPGRRKSTFASGPLRKRLDDPVTSLKVCGPRSGADH